ncbi:MAG: hypothetical protein HY996_01360, partial [Micrococcales bacterium]|nr:hypothetical protein [Micrococcales bacterium]
MSLRRSAVGGAGLALRELRSGLGPSLLVAAVVAVTVLLAVATPAVLNRYADAELRARLAAVPDVSRSVSGDGYFPLPTEAPGSSAAVWAPVTEAVEEFRARLGQPARAGIGTPVLQVRTTDAYVAVPGLPGRLVGLALVADPGFDARVRWIAGAPRRRDVAPPAQNADGTFTIPTGAPPVPIGLSERSSAQLRASVGTVLGSGPGYLVAGVYRPRDPGALAWRASAGLVQPGVRLSADGTPSLVVAAVVSPRTPGNLGVLRDGALRILLPVRADAWRSRDATRIGAQLRAAALRGIDLPDGFGGSQVMLLRTGATVAIDESVRRGAALQTTTALAAAGPVGVALLVLGLGVGGVLRRWRPALEIASARGASGLRMRGAAALETLVFCVPAAVVAAAIGTVLLPGPPSPAGLAVGAGLGLAPAAVAAALARPAGRGARGDLGGRVRTASGAPAFGAARPGRRRGRWVVEVVVLVAAAAVTWSLVNRGTGQDAAALDPLLVAAPLLLAVAVGVLVLRLYPVPLRAGQRALRRCRRAPALIGVARAVREPTVGLAAVLAILVGVSVGVLSATLGATVDAATRTAARTAGGA